MKTLLFCVLFIIGPSKSFCQQQLSGQTIIERVPKEFFFSKLKTLETQFAILSDAPEGKYRNIILSCRKIVREAIAYEVNFEGDFPKLYANSIDYLVDFCIQIRRTETAEERELMASIILADLTLKFVERNQFRASINDRTVVSNKLVDVIVLTRKDNKDINALRVNWSPLAFHTSYDKPTGAFGKLTTPSNEAMVPGIYMFWITKDGDSVVLNKKEREVNRETSNLIEFAVQ